MGISVFPVPASGISASDLITQPKWERIAQTSTDPGAATLTISNIPSTYTTLKIGFYGIKATSGSEYNLNFRINSDSGSVYNYHYGALKSTTTGQLGDAQNNKTSIQLNQTTADNGSTDFIGGELTIQNYSSSTQVEKYFEGWSSYYAYAGNFQDYKFAGMYIPTAAAAVTSISFIVSTGNLDIITAPAGVYVLGAK